MKKLIILAALAATATGCQTRITAEKRGTEFHPIESVILVPEGQTTVKYVTGYAMETGGYYMTARSPLWATEGLKGLTLDIGQGANHVAFGLDEYNRDLSTNAVAMVSTLSELAADIAGKVTAAICAYYGGGAVSATSKLGELTIKDITGRVQAKLAKRGITDANCADCNPAALAKEVAQECVGGACDTCADGACNPQ